MCSNCGGHTDPTDATPSANESRILARVNRLIAAAQPPSNATEVQMDFTKNEPTPITPANVVGEAVEQSIEPNPYETRRGRRNKRK